MTAPDVDPFSGGESAPSLSFKDKPVGTVQTITVTDAAKLVQSRDLNTDLPAVWPDGNPKMCAVINGDDEQGEPRSVWAAKPSALFTAIKEAQAAVAPDYRLKAGDTLAIKYTGEKPASRKGFNPQKLYAAKITVGVAPVAPADDPWDSTPAADGDEPPF
jgi:hypothetical protein